jgi:hypothetical protein
MKCVHALVAGLAGLLIATAALAGSMDLPTEARVLAQAKKALDATRQELEGFQWPEAAAWKESKASGPVLVWAFADSVGALQPSFWLVGVRKGNDLVGLLALDPQEGTLVWRATRLSKEQAKLAEAALASPADRMAAALRKAAGDREASFDFDRSVLATVNGVYYWVAPDRGENLVGSLTLPAGGKGKAQELWETLPAARAAQPARLVPATSGAPFYLATDSLNEPAASTWMVGEVPLYAAPGAAVGWTSTLSMVRQWWSPVTMGKRGELDAVWRYTLNRPEDEGVTLRQLYELTVNGPAVDAAFDKGKGQNGFPFEPFRTLWFGSGKALGGSTELTDSCDDLRGWILRETPVIVALDADGAGETEGADQFALVIGYSDAHGLVYLNNPYGLGDTFAYDAFTRRFWGAWYTEDCAVPTLCDSVTLHRRGMVAAAPGDFVGPPTPRPSLSCPGVATDSQPATVANIGMVLSPPDAPAFAGKDAFGQVYRTECRVELPGGRFHGSAGKGDWSDLKDARGNDRAVVTASLDNPLYPGQAVGGGRFDVLFADAAAGGPVEITSTCTVHDSDDRAHFLHKRTVTVFDDSRETDGRRPMRLPLLRPAIATASGQLTVTDDDPSPPRVTLLSAPVVSDARKGAYRFEVRIEDASPIAKATVAYAFEEKEPKSFDSFDGNNKGEYWKEIPRDKWVEQVGKTLHVWVRAVDDDADRKGDASQATRHFAIPVVDDDPIGPVVVQYVARRAENMQFQILVKLEDTSGVYVDHAWPKLYYSFKGPVSAESFDGIAKMVAAPKMGPGWFTAVAPWGEQGALAYAASEQKKEDTYIYLKVRSYDLDGDRKGDDSETWSQGWAEVYLPAPLTDTTTIVDIWPAGDREAGVNSLWDDWFDPPPKHVPHTIFFEGRPAEVSPPPVPEVLTGQNAKIRIHITVSLAFVHSGAHLAITGSSLSLAPYKLEAAIVSKKGIYELGTMTFPSEEQGDAAEVKLEVPSGALSTGENILVLKPADGTGEYDQISIQRIHLEANELPKPPKIEGFGVE